MLWKKFSYYVDFGPIIDTVRFWYGSDAVTY